MEYTLYKDEDEFRQHHPREKIVPDWRGAQIGEWIKSDDGKVMSIIHRWNMKDTSEETIRPMILYEHCLVLLLQGNILSY